jgi:hypothetical protein
VLFAGKSQLRGGTVQRPSGSVKVFSLLALALCLTPLVVALAFPATSGWTLEERISAIPWRDVLTRAWPLVIPEAIQHAVLAQTELQNP